MSVAAATPDEPNDRTLVGSIPEAANWLRCGRSTVYELIEKGEIQSLKIGRRRLVTYASCAELVARLSNSASR